ncbi:winged helix-turn-helix transcriptional regulator [Rhodococcus chondri]|uniref:Helix-turn-helix domain-containing protein n=1 Tax=Rhodococcus chondri TaxID=3065941 RepID=A0ABU7JUA7_9NOCA|nr:helix-turn-helix domain-containing protein [Rhodococcus sp. CC-R104]MEE2033611.1 helix-turn-helix domain-containing protein [Rhodococcus sp. CC-R104]
MDWLELSTDNCPVQRTLDLVGQKWTLLIIREAVNGVKRFDDFRQHLGISEAVLTDRLRILTAAGILTTREYRQAGSRGRREYVLTDKGWDLWPIVVALRQWGDKHAVDPEGPLLEVRHDGCGSPIRVVVECSAGHGALTPHDVSVTLGPAARPLPHSAT